MITIKFTKKKNHIQMSINGKKVCAFCNTEELMIHPMDQSLNVMQDGKLVATFETISKKVEFDFKGFDDIF